MLRFHVLIQNLKLFVLVKYVFKVVKYIVMWFRHYGHSALYNGKTYHNYSLTLSKYLDGVNETRWFNMSAISGRKIRRWALRVAESRLPTSGIASLQ